MRSPRAPRITPICLMERCDRVSAAKRCRSPQTLVERSNPGLVTGHRKDQAWLLER
jgi:hypothetical protein